MKINPYNLMTLVRARVLTFVLTLIVFCTMGMSAVAQTTLTTNFANNNGSSVAIFSFSNDGASPVLINSIGTVAGATATYTCHLYVHSATYGTAPGAPLAITSANGWSLVGSNSSVALTANTTGSGSTATTVISGMNYSVPPLTQVRFAIQLATGAGLPAYTTTAGNIRYSSLAAGVYPFSGGGCTLTSGTGYGYAGTMTSPTNTPRGFIGFITFSPSTPCSGTPAPGNTISSANPACTGSSFTLSLQNSTLGTGVTYQWQSADDVSFTVNLTYLGTNPTETATQSTQKYYRCQVTCSGNTGTSNPLLVTMNSLLNCYCLPSQSSGCSADYISNVTFASINRASTCDGGTTRNVFTTPNPTLIIGANYSLSVSTGGDTEGAGVWIDWNGNGTFDVATEQLLSAYAGTNPATYTASVTVPGTAVPGTVLMRVRCNYAGVSSPCTAQTWGECEDYYVTIAAPTPCSGTPAVGTVTSNINAYGSVCAGANFTLSLSGIAAATGLAYQWQSSPDNIIAYADIAGATNATLTANTTSSTWYRCVVTCTNSGLSSTSSVYQVIVNSLACYCLGTYTNAGGSGGDYGLNITNVTIAGINNNSTPNLAMPYVYSNYTYLSGNVEQSNTYPISISRTYTGNTIYWGVWVDWNNSGTFTDNANEYTSLTAIGVTGGTGAATGTGSIVVPAGALPGPHVMRIRANFSVDPGQASVCNNYTYGETEDYILNVVTACTGTPVPGTTLSSTALACPNIPFTLYLQGVGAALGLTYQWQTSPDNIAPYTDISGATNATTSQTQNSSAYYRCMITCSNSGLSASSTPVQVNMNTFANCICNTPVYSIVGCTGTTANDYIGQVTFAGINNTTGCGATSPNYQFFSGQVANVNQTVTYPITISAPAGGAAFQRFKVYIDFNDNASFDDPGETVFNSGPISTSGNTASGNISISPTAPLGTHRLRVRSTNPLSTNLDANSCSDDGYIGEVEDYSVTVSGPPPCSGTPTPGQTLASTPLACNSTSITLGLQNATSGTGVTYQWQSSSDALFTSPVNLGTNSTQVTTQTATTWYRCIVTCSGNNGISTPVQVSHSVPCYCTNPVHGSDGCSLGLYINNFTFAGINNTSGCYSSIPYTTPFYSYFPNQTANVDLGVTYPLSITTPPNAGSYYNHFAVWIDFNDNGSFDDAGEAIVASALGATTTTNSLTGNYTIPNTTPPGTHKLRIRSGNNDANWTSCAAASSGETEDYNIIVAPPATSASSNTPVCETTTLNLSALPNGATSYSWTGPNGFSSNLQNPSITNVTTAAAGVYTCTMVIFGFTYTATTTVAVNVNPTVSVTASPAFCEGTADLVIDANATGGLSPYVYTYNGNNTNDGVYTFPNAPASASGNYSITVTDNNGCQGTGSVLATVYALPPVTITPIGNTNICTGQTTTDLQASGALTFVWSTSETTSLITVTGQGTYIVTGTDNHNCVNSNSQVITESAPPVAPIVTPTGPITLCTDGFTTTSVNLSVSNYSSDLLWSTGETDQSITVNYPDVFNAVYTDVNGCYSVSNSVVTTVDMTSTAPTGATSNVLFNNVCLGNSVTLSVAGGSLGDNAVWKWYEGGCAAGAPVGTGPSPVITPTTTGTHVYYVRAESASCGNTSCASITITVTTAPPLSGATITVAPVAGCNGSTAVVSGPNVNGATYYNWSCPQGGVLFNGNPGPYQTATPSVTVTFTSLPPAGASGYSICLFAGNACGQSQSFCKFVRARISQPAAINGSIIACPSTNGTYSVPVVTGANTYTWTVTGNATINGGGTTLTTASNSITVNFGAGWTSGTLSVYASLTCGFNSPVRNLSFSTTPAVPGTMSGPGNVCPGGSGSFSIAPVSGASNYVWTCSVPGSLVTPSGTSCTVVFPAVIPPGSTVCVAAVSACGSSSTNRCKGVASGIPGTPGIITGPTTGNCGATGVSFVVSTPSTGATSYVWSITGGATIQLPNNLSGVAIDFPSNYTTGTITVNGVNSCGNGGTRSLAVIGAPAMPGAITGNGVPCAGNTETYTAGGSAGATSYNWTVPAGSSILSSPPYSNSILVLVGSTSGNVTASAANDCGVSGTRSFALSINCRQSQIQESASAALSIYPNPTPGNVTISFNSGKSENVLMNVTDLAGRSVLTQQISATEGMNTHETDLSSLAKGVYLIELSATSIHEVMRVTVE